MVNNSLRKDYLKASVIGLIIIAVSFFIHIHPSFNSMINFKTSVYNTENACFSNDYIQVVLDYHKDHPVFSRRPMTTFLIETVKEVTGVGLAASFALVGFFFFYVNGLLVYALSRFLKSTSGQALWSMLLYHLSFTILFPYFRTTYTYDEPLQYFFCLLALIGIYKPANWLMVLGLTGAVFARESSLVVFPSFFLLYYFKGSEGFKIRWDVIRKALLFAVPVVIYLGYYGYHLSTFQAGVEADYDEASIRVSQLSYNFQSNAYTLETISLFLIVNLFPLVLLFLQPRSDRSGMLIKAFWVLLGLNTIMVLLGARVSESRVLTLPLLLLWPLMGGYVQAIGSDLIVQLRGKKMRIVLLISMMMMALAAYFGAFKVYEQTGAKADENLFNEYFFMVLFTSGMLLLLHAFRKKV
ncbi:MAG: hypothetical protein KDD41_00770 [Flavobacteriales bacterium]|nr:hypothetical protein [Flavobacteriales bacterium]